jgi:hypothetical protein
MDLDGIRVEGKKITYTDNEGNLQWVEFRSQGFKENDTIDKLTYIDKGLSLHIKMDSGEEFEFENFRDVGRCFIRKKAVTFSDIAFIDRG